MDLTLTTRSDNEGAIVEVGGEVDVFTAPKLRDLLASLTEEGQTRLIVDLQQVQFLDSTGLGVLVGSLKRIRNRGGSLELVCSQPRLLKIFKITGLDTVFTIHADVGSAS